MSASDPPPQGILRHRPFLLYWCARVGAELALQIQAVAVGWQMYELTSSPLSLGLVGLAQFVPAVLLALVAGHVADRYDRRGVIRIAQVAAGAAIAVLAIGTASAAITQELILGMVFIIGAARAFDVPAIQALLPTIVPARLFSRAVPAASAAVQLSRIAGPALGGVLYVISPTLAYAVCAAMFFLTSVLVSLVRLEIRFEGAAPRPEPITFGMIFAGIAFIRRQPVILGAITLDLFAVLLGGATALLPVFARDIFATGPWGLGAMRLAPAIGALGMSFALGRWPVGRHAGYVMFVAVTAYGFATIVFGLSTSFPLALTALAVLGASDMISVVVRQLLVQLGTPDAMRGRVSAVNSLFVGTSNQLGQFESGVTAYWFGTVPAVVLGGIGTVLVVLIATKAFPQLLRTDQLAQMQPTEAEVATARKLGAPASE